MENNQRITTMSRHFAYLEYAQDQLEGAHVAIMRLHDSKDLQKIITKSILKKMQAFFTDVIFVVQEIGFLRLIYGASDQESLDNISIEIDSLVTQAKEIMGDIKQVISHHAD